MTEPAPESIPEGEIPLGQRLFDNVYLLLAAGIVVVFILYTGWGVWEIMTLPPSSLR